MVDAAYLKRRTDGSHSYKGPAEEDTGRPGEFLGNVACGVSIRLGCCP